MRKSHCDRILLLLLAAKACQCTYTYEKIGDSRYFIGKGNSDEQIFDWFDARHSCRAQGGQLVSVQTAKQLIELEHYILAQGYPNGSMFSTSGHSFESEYPFKWSALGKSVTYTKWLPGEGPPLNSFLSLQLVNSELFMVTSWGFDQFYICEYETIGVWLVTNLYNPFYLILVILILVFLYTLIKKKRAVPEEEQLLKN
ncbi:uncharacterized protein LOC115763520 [Drosophila novamexicana]|uniref:uncharacterized protein LOC115763520 n=1 Tax=Drosophila novamexicana TaxID=47314 RepID=UPI0011E5E84B|nr:uncharacterized protein LOC115763520 [Drosophila novamexicana]